MVSSFFLSRPYARAEAVGSLMMRITSRPAILPASLVACRWLSLKYAGTVMTACVTGWPKYASASDLSLPRIMAEISCGLYSRPVTGILTRTSSAGPGTTSYETILRSCSTSSNRRPLGGLTDQALAILGECHNRRAQAAALRSGDHGCRSAFHDGDNAVCRSQVNSYNFSHSSLSLLFLCHCARPFGVPRSNFGPGLSVGKHGPSITMTSQIRLSIHGACKKNVNGT